MVSVLSIERNEHWPRVRYLTVTEEARTELGISPGTVRFSAGIEDTQDLIEDFARALKSVQA